MAALLAVLLVGMAAFAVDLGIGYASKRQLSVTSDAAALAGAQAAGRALRTQYPAGQGCSTAVAAALAPAARTAAIEVYNAQLPDHSDGDPTVTVTCEDADHINVEVTSGASFNTLFGGALGVKMITPGAAATAQVSGSQAYYGLRPFAICLDDIGETLPVGTVQSEFSGGGTNSIQCGPLPPGNWGVVDFDAGSNPTGDVADWTEFGYPGAVTIPDDAMDGDPGANFASSQIEGALTSIVGDTVMFPVASQWADDGGNNGSFKAVGVLSVKVCGWAELKQNGTIKQSHTDPSCWKPNLVPTASAGTDLIIQWKYAAYSGTYDGTTAGTDCSLDDILCVPVVRLYK